MLKDQEEISRGSVIAEDVFMAHQLLGSAEEVLPLVPVPTSCVSLWQPWRATWLEMKRRGNLCIITLRVMTRRSEDNGVASRQWADRTTASPPPGISNVLDVLVPRGGEDLLALLLPHQ